MKWKIDLWIRLGTFAKNGQLQVSLILLSANFKLYKMVVHGFWKEKHKTVSKNVFKYLSNNIICGIGNNMIYGIGHNDIQIFLLLTNQPSFHNSSPFLSSSLPSSSFPTVISSFPLSSFYQSVLLLCLALLSLLYVKLFLEMSTFRARLWCILSQNPMPKACVVLLEGSVWEPESLSLDR